MASVNNVDFLVLVPSSDGENVVLAGGKFTEDCKMLSEADLNKEVKKGYEFCSHVLIPSENLFQRFNDEGKIEDFMHVGVYWGSVWQNRRTRKSVYGIHYGTILRSNNAYEMLEKGYMGMPYGFNFSKVSCVSGMEWHTGLIFPEEEKKKYVWVVTTDGSSHGEYENGSSVGLFATEEEAIRSVKDSLQENVVDGIFCGRGYTDKELEQECDSHCKWYGNDVAQFKNGDSVTDYKIEKIPVPEKKGSN